MAEQSRDKDRRSGGLQMGGRWADEHQSFDRTAIQIPEGFQTFKVASAGNRKLDFYPYIVGQGNKWCDPGLLHYERTYFVHFGIGPNQGAYVCPARLHPTPQRCPICEYANSPQCDKETNKKLQAKERQLWLVKDLGEPQKGIQIWDYSYHLFGKQLRNCFTLSPIELNYKNFTAPWDPKTLLVGFVEKPTGFGKPCYEAANFIFMPRAKLTKAEVQALPCLDDLVLIKPYNELKEIFFQTVQGEEIAEVDTEETVQTAPRSQSRRPDPAPPTEADDWAEQAVAQAPRQRSAKAPVAAPEPEADDWGEVEPAPVVAPAAAPRRRPAAQPAAEAPPVDY